MAGVVAFGPSRSVVGTGRGRVGHEQQTGTAASERLSRRMPFPIRRLPAGCAAGGRCRGCGRSPPTSVSRKMRGTRARPCPSTCSRWRCRPQVGDGAGSPRLGGRQSGIPPTPLVRPDHGDRVDGAWNHPVGYDRRSGDNMLVRQVHLTLDPPLLAPHPFSKHPLTESMSATKLDFVGSPAWYTQSPVHQ